MKRVKGLGPKPAALQFSRGFSLLEMMFVITIISIVVAAILTQVEQVQQRAAAEQGKLDQFQDARNFVDQIAIDARQMGYPNFHNFDISQGVWQSPLTYDSRLAVGLVKLTDNSLRFEGDIDGSGTVREVSYKVNGDGNCGTCLERAQVAKSNGDPLSQAPAAADYTAEIQNVQNTSSIFTAFDDSGATIALPIDITNNAASVAKVRVIQISLDVSDPTKLDPKTGQALEANITSRVQVVNCSMATTGLTTGGGIQLTCQ